MNKYEGHTPGPWNLERDRHKSLSVYGGLTFVGEVYRNSDEPSTEEDANCALIAAAPELLAQRDQLAEILTDALGVIGSWGEEGDPAWAERARAALRAVEES